MASAAERVGIRLRVSVAGYCGLRCAYCHPRGTGGEHAAGSSLSFPDIVAVALACRAHADSVQVRVTGGEPLLRPGVDRLVAMLRDAGFSEISLTTNGLRLPETADALARAGLVRVNVSLDTLDPAVFRDITGGDGLHRVIAGIHAARDVGLTPVKLNCVVMRGVNDLEACDLVGFAFDAGCEMRFIELMPMGPAASWHSDAFVRMREVEERLSGRFDLLSIPTDGHAPARMAEARCRETGRSGRVGFIAPVSEPFCSGCRRLRLTSDGHLVSCLRDSGGESLLPLFGYGDAQAELARAVGRALDAKPACGTEYPTRPMVAVGG